MIYRNNLRQQINVFKSNSIFADPYRDPEVEEWAALKIQQSFKTYKNQKSENSQRVGQLS